MRTEKIGLRKNFYSVEKSLELTMAEVSADMETKPLNTFFLNADYSYQKRRGLSTEESKKARREAWRSLDLERMGLVRRKP